MKDQNQQSLAEEPHSKKFPVIELFGPVLQGEGVMVGSKTLFIRFGGCDYRCAKCDSLHAVMPRAVQKHARYLTAQEIAEACIAIRAETGVQWVTFSGGNPCMHQLQGLVDLLIGVGFMINVETQGTLTPEWLKSCHVVTMSPKAPGIGEKFETDKFQKFMSVLSPVQQTCLKIAVFNQVDLEFALTVYQLYTQHFGGYSMTPYLSLGNPFPPILNDQLDLEENPMLGETHPSGSRWADGKPDQVKALLAEYRIMSEEICNDPRFVNWKFLPQLHVLMYGNEAGR